MHWTVPLVALVALVVLVVALLLLVLLRPPQPKVTWTTRRLALRATRS